MPDFGMVHIGFLGLMLLLGLIIGWVLRGDRCSKEKIAVNASWQEQIDAQQSENDRLSTQNMSLMEQIGQYQASNKDSKMRSKELSDALKEAFERRDELQRTLKETRTQYDVATAQRDKLLADIENNAMRGEATAGALREKDDKIFRLSRELTTWQSRVPPLVERFRERDQEAKALQAELDEANEKIAALEDADRSDHTRIEPLDKESLPEGLDASNEQYASTLTGGDALLQDQIIPGRELPASVDEDVADTVDDAEGVDDGHDGTAEHHDFDKSVYSDETVQHSAIVTPESSDDIPDEPEEAVEAIAEEDIDDKEGDFVEAAVAAVAMDDSHDDLQKIKGVGPAIEKTLNGLGIFRFNQIAEMSEYDIDRVAQQLRGFRSRIYREDWIGQARTLQYQKNNDYV